MSKAEPTAAAMRATEKLHRDGWLHEHFYYDLSSHAMNCIAGVIDEAIHLPEIREALKLGRDYAREALPDRSAIEDIQTIDAAIAALEGP